METKVEIKMLFETLLTSPGMADVVKLDLKLTRRAALLLATAVQAGLASAKTESSLLTFTEAATNGELSEIVEAVLEKAGLTQTNQKLSALS